ncbi:MAG: phosphatase PAP2 family protein [Acidimicrobiia bacterium]|nr:phosphatase PAP2 family protein [Acidimicrobiia bacterium]
MRAAAGRAVLTAAAFATAVRRARDHDVGSTEERIFRAVNAGPDTLYPPVWMLMQSGSLAAVFVTAAAVHRRRDPVVTATLVVAGTAVWGGVKLVKPLIGRGRPQHHLGDVRVRGRAQTGLGFPSGHAAVATTLALIVTRPRSPARAAALATAVATGVSRMYVGAHLPLDVIGGLAIGAAAGSTANACIRRCVVS